MVAQISAAEARAANDRALHLGPQGQVQAAYDTVRKQLFDERNEIVEAMEALNANRANMPAAEFNKQMDSLKYRADTVTWRSHNYSNIFKDAQKQATKAEMDKHAQPIIKLTTGTDDFGNPSTNWTVTGGNAEEIQSIMNKLKNLNLGQGGGAPNPGRMPGPNN